MYYLYLGRQGSFQSPESIIVELEGNYFYRGIHTDWFMMDGWLLIIFSSS